MEQNNIIKSMTVYRMGGRDYNEKYDPSGIKIVDGYWVAEEKTLLFEDPNHNATIRSILSHITTLPHAVGARCAGTDYGVEVNYEDGTNSYLGMCFDCQNLYPSGVSLTPYHSFDRSSSQATALWAMFEKLVGKMEKHW